MNCAVIGGGIAGLTAAVYLTEAGNEVTLFESTNLLGGRLKPVNFPNSDFPTVDYGQHALATAYKYTFRLMEKLGSFEKLKVPNRLDITFIKGTERAKFITGYLPYPFNLLFGIMGFKFISGKERRALIKFLFFIRNSDESFYTSKDLITFFKKHNQNENLIKTFWEKVVLSIFNTPVEKVDPQLFVSTMRKLFFDKKDNFIVFTPNLTLNELLVTPATKFIEKRSGSIHLSEKVVKLNVTDNNISRITTLHKEYDNFDIVILAIPPEQAAKLLPDSELKTNLNCFTYSPILTAYLKVSVPFIGEKMITLINSKIDWIFNFGSYISVVISSNKNISDMDKKNQKKIIFSELNKFFPVFSTENVLDLKLINEKKSTIMSDNLINRLRDKIYSPFNNLIFAGDWTNTDLPATIESAVLSGKNAAWRVENSLKLWT